MIGRTLKLAAVGCGRVFERYHLPAIRALAHPSSRSDGVAVRLVAACEIDPMRRDWAKGALPGVPCMESVEDLVRSATAEAVLVSTPPAIHAAIAGLLLRAGLHVLVEKPMTIGLDEAQELHAAQRDSERVLRVGFNRRYRTSYARLRRRVQSEGKVRSIGFTFVSDAARWNPDASAADPEFLLQDAGSHAVDLVAHVGGAPIESIRATQDEQTDARLVRIEARLAGGGFATCTVGQGSRYNEQLVAGSERGEHRADSSGQTLASRLAITAQLASRKLIRQPTPADESFRSQLAAFAAACHGRDDGIGAGPADGVESVAAVDACIASISGEGAWRILTRLPSTRTTAQ